MCVTGSGGVCAVLWGLGGVCDGIHGGVAGICAWASGRVRRHTVLKFRGRAAADPSNTQLLYRDVTTGGPGAAVITPIPSPPDRPPTQPPSTRAARRQTFSAIYILLLCGALASGRRKKGWTYYYYTHNCNISLFLYITGRPCWGGEEKIKPRLLFLLPL